MNAPSASIGELTGASRRLAQRILAAGENRIELVALELREERERLLRTIFLALAAALFGLLAVLSLTATLTVVLWTYSPWLALVGSTACYAGIAAALGMRLRRILRTWSAMPETLNQLRKDRECLENILR